MSLPKTLLTFLGTLLIGAMTFVVTGFKPDAKIKTVQLTKKKTNTEDSENLFI